MFYKWKIYVLLWYVWIPFVEGLYHNYYFVIYYVHVQYITLLEEKKHLR